MELNIIEGYILDTMRDRRVRRTLEVVLVDRLKTRGYVDVEFLTDRFPTQNLKKSKNYLELYILGIKNNIEDNNIDELINDINKAAELLVNENNSVPDYSSCVYFLMALLCLYSSKRDKYKFIDRIYDVISMNLDITIRSLGGCEYIYYNDDLILPKVIFNLSDYTDYIEGLYKNIATINETVFFRGHSSVRYDIKPSLFREQKWLDNEKLMYYELLNRCPEEFDRLSRHIDILAKMQHYALPTRLLDITKNPLVALYFAAQNTKEKVGVVLTFMPRNQNIKYSNSDTVAILTSLPAFSKDEQMDLYHASTGKKDEFGEHTLNRLAAEVLNEKPFVAKIDEKDLNSALICVPTQTNKRVIAQDGAFIVCGLFPEIYEPKGYGDEKTLIDMQFKIRSKISACFVINKKHILEELDHIGVNKATMFPEIDTVSSYIKGKLVWDKQ